MKILIEIKIVAISVLLVLVFCHCGTERREGNEKIQSDATLISHALDIYYLEKGRFPMQEESLDILFPYYIRDKKCLRDPWGNQYKFEIKKNKKEDVITISVISLGADNKRGGEGRNEDEVVSEEIRMYSKR